MPVRTTWASGTIAPVLSVTVPSIELLNWARAMGEKHKNATTSQIPFDIHTFMIPPLAASEMCPTGTQRKVDQSLFTCQRKMVKVVY
jgi:hypothetical protein